MATLKPPPAQHRSSSSSHTSTGPPKAPLKADPSSTIADTAVFQGTYPVTIGANTIIHPRARFYAYEGPIYVGDGCIISEKATIGAAPSKSRSRSRSPSPSPSQSGESTPTDNQPQPTQELTTRLSYFVIIGPQATVLPGAHIHSSTHVEALCIIHRRADVGSHVKICSGCEVPESGNVPEWIVVWGSGLGQRRRRVRDAKMPGLAVMVASLAAQNPVPGAAPEGKVIEDARLMVLQKEREALARMIVPAGAGKKK
ncbi:hypothetical protein N7456_012424 [Penicillium angulare]|uniref:Dynactin subunit 6 n=1 Tax=Penicillium angulare TaxID=116970 RepID=A0A9W9EVM6_9EURO|nr:hypothetical protein N7456_012424 [Penicillium angulare]